MDTEGEARSPWIARLVADALRRGDSAIALLDSKTAARVSVALPSDEYAEIVDAVGQDRAIAFVRAAILRSHTPQPEEM